MLTKCIGKISLRGNVCKPDADEGGDGEEHGCEGARHDEGDAVDHVAREVLGRENKIEIVEVYGP